ncbi:MAG: DUF5723 family protein [Flavipsychrobacter sp.]|nr:DUF5723 family protein [Flavipsychrobacter sp.]
MKKIILASLLVTIAAQAEAQMYFSEATSLWSGTNSLYLNPANGADNHLKISVDIFSINAGVNTNIGTLRSSNILANYNNTLTTDQIFNYGSQNPFNMLAPYGEVRGPGIMYAINDKNTLAITTRVRAFNQFSNFDQSVYRIITDPTFSSSSDYGFTSKNYNWTAQVWSEIGLSYSAVIFSNEHHEIKGGLTARYLGGIGYAGIKGKNLDAHYYSKADSLQINNTDLEYGSNVINSQVDLSNGIAGSDIMNRFFGGANGGAGVGGDLGLVYEWNPASENNYYEMDGAMHKDPNKSSYKLKLSIAVTDIGGITYKGSNFTANFTGNGYLSGNDLITQFKNYNDFRDYALSHHLSVDTGSHKSTTVHLPTALMTGVDYHIYHKFYISVNYLANLADKNDFGNHYYDQITFTPRYDTRILGISAPVTYSSLDNHVKLGFGVRVSGFFVGSDDMLALFNNNQYGFNLHAGGFVPISRKKIRDRDHDHISDRMDKCPLIPGVLTAKGCPDRDRDSVADGDDRCPDDSGAVALQGCPDKDGDGVPDIDDKCPTQAGLAELHGCPDSDADGVPDNEDACPYKFGLPQFHGCPDTDGDGIPDNEDACPTQAGPAKFKGCPDTDGDNIPDNLDKCPNDPGPISNDGCPVKKKEVTQEVKKKLDFAATAIEFETGKDVIKATSYPLLNDIVKILKEYPDNDMNIDGYTDNVGKPEMNMKLSKERAEAVKAYFVKEGVSANRLHAAGHGEEHPAASNKTKIGRAKNRRVHLELKKS